MKNKSLLMRMGFAISGLRFAVKRERSLRFQLVCAVGISMLMLMLQPEFYWWAIVFVVIAMVIAAEMFNTAVESLCDFIQPEHDEKIKNIKDVAAGAVLVTSIAAVSIAILLLLDLLT